MYYPIECLKILNIPYSNDYHISCVKSNNDRTKICILTKNGILLWLTASNQLIAFHVRSKASIQSHGENYMVEWKSDSSKIAILTNTCHLIFYQVVLEHNSFSNILFGERVLDNTPNNNFYQYHIVKCKLKHENTLKIQEPVERIYNYLFDDELFVSTKNGDFLKFNWKTHSEYQFLSIKNIQLKVELTDNAKSLRITDDIYAIDFEITNILGAICIALVLSDGSAAYLVGENTESDNTFQGLVAQVLGHEKLWKQHTCVAINPLYQLLAYGCRNGQAIAYYPDEVTLSLQYSNAYQINSGSDISSGSGSSNSSSTFNKNAIQNPVVKMKWTPDYRLLVTLYDNGAIGLFSVFGSLLFYSKNYSMYPEKTLNSIDVFKGMDFSTEGYSIWLHTEPNETNRNGTLGVLKFVKSSLANNPAGITEHIVLQGENRIRICLNVFNTTTSKSLAQQSAPNDAANKYNCSPPTNQIPHAVTKHQQQTTQLNNNALLGGNKMWQLIDLPLNYISTNFPIRYVATDKYGKYLAVAGMYGFTHYSFATRKWKLFGNASQEKDMTITCGLVWWNDFICLGCFNFHDGLNEIRFYSRHTNLDNHYASTVKLNNNVTKINIYEDILVILCSDCNIILYGLETRQKETTRVSVTITKLIEFSIENYVSGNPFSVLSIALSDLRVEASLNKTDTYSTTWSQQQHQHNAYMESILINVSGRLLVLQRDKNGPSIPAKNIKKMKSLLFQPPLIIASCVENIWTTSSFDCNNAYMKSSLWLSCGSNGMKVWMPLSYKDDSVRFQSQRIMLSFPLTIYPLAILINEAVILGITNEYYIHDNIVYNQIHKSSQIFLNSLLVQLLRKNLDFDALQIAMSARHLQHFSHILELLLHQILELEATSSEPIPDPLLPRIVVFIHEFAEFLQIVSHCTRKTDIALWPYLFIIVGNPSDLFEECLVKNYLETAASYLIILQNTVKSSLCKNHATVLLRASLNQSNWRLAKDIFRFLSSIDPNDLEKEHPVAINDALPLLAFKKESFLSTSLNLKFQQNLIINSNKHATRKNLQKNSSFETPNTKKQSTEPNAITSVTQQSPQQTQQQQTTLLHSPSHQTSTPTSTRQRLDSTSLELMQEPMMFLFDSDYIEKIIFDHALVLLKKNKLKKLGYMSANLSNFSMLKWLKSEPQCAKIESFVETLLMIHTDFQWPLPIATSKEPLAKQFSINSDTSAVFSNPSDHLAKTDETEKNFILENGTSSHSQLDFGADSEAILLRNEYLNLITQELANRGPTQSEAQLKYLTDVFMSAECYEWAFVIALALKNFTIISEILYKCKTIQPSINFTGNFYKGLNELHAWAKNEYLGYGQIVQNIINYIDRNSPSGFSLNTANMQATSQTQKTPTKGQQSPQIDLVKLKNSDKSPSTPTSNIK